MLKSHKYRLAPTKEQEILLNKHFDAVRFIHNLALETKNWAWCAYKHNISRYDLSKQLTDLKKEAIWLNEINSLCFMSVLLNLDSAYNNFFKGRGKYPKFKNKFDKQSFSCHQNVAVENGKISLPKFREGIGIILSREIVGEIKTITISKTTTGKYFASILIDNGKSSPNKKKINPSTSVGIDMGLKTFITTSDGKEYANPRHLKNSLQRLKVLQRRLSHKKKGSKNRNKARYRVALLHEKIVNQRKDFLHKVSNEITNQYDTICLEDLNIKWMLANHKLAQAVSDVGWNMFENFIKYKSEWRGKNLLYIGRFEPSSKIHSTCGYINSELKLSDREWYCPNCNENVFRDLNAAINIKNFALNNSGRGTTVEPVELPTLVGAKKQEKLI